MNKKILYLLSFVALLGASSGQEVFCQGDEATICNQSISNEIFETLYKRVESIVDKINDDCLSENIKSTLPQYIVSYHERKTKLLVAPTFLPILYNAIAKYINNTTDKKNDDDINKHFSEENLKRIILEKIKELERLEKIRKLEKLKKETIDLKLEITKKLQQEIKNYEDYIYCYIEKESNEIIDNILKEMMDRANTVINKIDKIISQIKQ